MEESSPKGRIRVNDLDELTIAEERSPLIRPLKNRAFQVHGLRKTCRLELLYKLSRPITNRAINHNRRIRIDG